MQEREISKSSREVELCSHELGIASHEADVKHGPHIGYIMSHSESTGSSIADSHVG